MNNVNVIKLLTFMAAEELDGMDEAGMEGAGPPHPRRPHAPLPHQPIPHRRHRRRRLLQVPVVLPEQHLGGRRRPPKLRREPAGRRSQPVRISLSYSGDSPVQQRARKTAGGGAGGPRPLHRLVVAGEGEGAGLVHRHPFEEGSGLGHGRGEEWELGGRPAGVLIMVGGGGEGGSSTVAAGWSEVQGEVRAAGLHESFGNTGSCFV